MAGHYEPLKDVEKSLRISWYRSPVDRETLRSLSGRSNVRGMLQTLGHLALCASTAWLTWTFFDRSNWVGFAIALFAHGTFYSFIAGITNHELSHGTVFKTKWLNGTFNRFYALISWFNIHDYKMSHTYHHRYTLHRRGDREVVLPTNPSLNVLFVLQLLTVLVYGPKREPYSYPLVPVIGGTIRLAVTGKHKSEWLNAVYADKGGLLRKSANWARLVLVFHVSLVAISVLLKLWLLPVLITFAPFIANWLRYLVSAAQHTGLRDEESDFRKCARTITLDPLTGFLYWQLNWHIEHHMYAAVPCYRLRKLHRALAADMPEPRTLFRAWKEMRDVRKKQLSNPGFQYDTPLPSGAGRAARNPSDLESSFGDLEPSG